MADVRPGIGVNAPPDVGYLPQFMGAESTKARQVLDFIGKPSLAQLVH